ncbi:C39 family peptidase [Ectobacillus panaciterrae]|uniref:C39 family peptidase n=1 Tax=Ectobacillus panaciterrae TaxID=363872 RepID=UPI0003F73ABC|nr:C39 family peptidase [Ectobacillus panaciterrae]
MRFCLYAVVIFLLGIGFIPKGYAHTQDVPVNDSVLDLWSVLSLSSKQNDAPSMFRPPSVLLHAPLISQMPELPRGCEVTSLAMLLQYKRVSVSKITLANEVKKDPAAYRRLGSTIYFGNPHYGFVGSMTSFKEPGFGVFHGPIYELANRYLNGNALDITGSTFDTVMEHVGQQKPVWVINTSTFDFVPSRYWQTWQTPHGPISITDKEHSVLVTGYDNQYVYFNDPLANIKNRKIPIAAFVRG